jgi:hypothetical protein
LWCCALAALMAGGDTVKAAWNNVFQVCCHNCRSATSNYVAAAPPAAPAACCPQQTCTTRYIQRCYYQPVTTYRQSCYMEPVTTYRTSYYYEPVTTYRYSCYYDPCSCSYQQVAQPVTSYRLRSQCCPVTSYLQRCCLQPVTTYQQAFYYEPVTTCCTTSVGAPVATLPPGATATPGAAAVPAVPSVPSPGVSSQPTNPPPAVSSEEGSPPAGQIQPQKYNSGYGDRPPKMPLVPDNSSFRQPQLQAPVPVQPAAPARDPRVRFDRITAAPRSNAAGQVLRADRVPQAGARIVFVSADNNGKRQAVTTDAAGRFETTLATGTWRIYVSDVSGRLVYQQKVNVRTDESVTPLTLVSR